jgi:hypothetical protein
MSGFQFIFERLGGHAKIADRDPDDDTDHESYRPFEGVDARTSGRHAPTLYSEMSLMTNFP